MTYAKKGKRQLLEDMAFIIAGGEGRNEESYHSGCGKGIKSIQEYSCEGIE
jgi:hypothetical protein